VKQRSLGLLVICGLLLAIVPASVLAAEAEVVEDIRSSIRYTDPGTGEPVNAIVDCDVLVHIDADDGSAEEWQACTISDEQPMGPVSPPAASVTETVGECIWTSDHQVNEDGSPVAAETVELTVTPSGRVYVWTTYPAEPLDCPEA
jgi:hypothetical protein